MHRRFSGRTPLAGLLALACTVSACSSGVDPQEPVDPRPVVVVPAIVAEDWQTDPIEIRRLEVDGDIVIIDVGFGGGCETHVFELVASSTFAESEPVRSEALLSHDDRGDPCDAYLLRTVQFDLRPLAKAWRRAYGEGRGRLVLDLVGWSAPILYEF